MGKLDSTHTADLYTVIIVAYCICFSHNTVLIFFNKIRQTCQNLQYSALIIHVNLCFLFSQELMQVTIGKKIINYLKKQKKSNINLTLGALLFNDDIHDNTNVIVVTPENPNYSKNYWSI